MKPTTHLHLALQLQMSGATPLLPLYAFTCAQWQLCLCTLHCVINIPYALRSIVTFCTKSHGDSKDPSMNQDATYLTCKPGCYLTADDSIFCNRMRQSLYLPSVPNTYVRIAYVDTNYCLHNDSLFWSMLYFSMLHTAIFSHTVYN